MTHNEVADLCCECLQIFFVREGAVELSQNIDEMGRAALGISHLVVIFNLLNKFLYFYS